MKGIYAWITHHTFDDIDIMTYNISIPKILDPRVPKELENGEPIR